MSFVRHLIAVWLVLQVGGAAADSCGPVRDAAVKQDGALAAIVDCIRTSCSRVTEVENLRPPCGRAIYVWPESNNGISAVIDDLKMCLPNGSIESDPPFMHGLAMALEGVSGIEDEQLYVPNSVAAQLWVSAWQAAVRRGIEEGSIALVINPALNRTQNQLHMHIVRRSRCVKQYENVVALPDLSDVWQAAARVATERNIACRNYGVMVFKRASDFGMLVEEGGAGRSAPEFKYTLYARSTPTCE